MIINAKNNKRSQLNDLPNVQAAVELWMQPMDVGVVQSSQVSGLAQEVVIWKPTHANRQPFTDQQLAIRPQGERAWRWSVLYAAPDLVLVPGDIAIVKGVRMRVMEKLDWSEYGYFTYNCVEDYNPNEIRQSSP